jgi:putative ABC transport system permease protein
LIVTLTAVITGLFAAFFLLTTIQYLINRNLVFHFDALFILFCVLLVTINRLIAGIYPAVILSGFNPVEVLKGKLSLKNNAGLFRKD